MIVAPLPANEVKRLAALRAYGVLDTPASLAFDDLTAIASQICGTPIALVSLLDTDRQWFLSRQGLDVTETPRDQAFCTHAILGTEPMVVSDAWLDERFVDNPLVVGGPHVRFYAGTPLVTDEGYALGTLCVIDQTPRELTPSQLAALSALGRQVVAQLELQRSAELLRASEAHYRAITATMQSGIVVQDQDARILWTNPSACELLGLTEDQLAGRSSFDPGWQAVHADGSDFPGDDHPSVKALRTREAVYGIVMGVFRPRNGDRVWLQVDAVPLFDATGTVQHVVANFVDITPLIEAERALREATERAEAATRAKGEFLATMSHEIRTPMNGVLGFANLLMDTPLTDEQRQYTATIAHSGKALLAVINDILDFSKIEAGQLVFESRPFDPGEVMREVAELLHATATGKGLAIHVHHAASLPSRVLGDSNRLRQVLLNFTGNAIKFTEFGSVSIVSDEVERAGQRFLRIAVKDTGIGIAPEKQQQLFQAFSQADSSTTRRFGGTGLGLAICKRLMTLMGGEVGVESAAGNGSTFWMQMPMVLPEGAESASATEEMAVARADIGAAPAHPPLGLRVLVAEDGPVNQMLVMKVLEKLGCSAELAVDGRAAVAIYHPARHDLILMDCHMPEMDGFEATAAIRAGERERSERAVPIVALTASATQEDRDQCLLAGMDDFVSKPFGLPELRAVLERWSALR